MLPEISVFSGELQEDIQNTGKAFLSAEEDATFILWAYPELLGWPRRIFWLFSPVTGRNRYPGDLWGIDGAGHLIVVETKLMKRRIKNPFEDFVTYREIPSPGELFKRWLGLYGWERKFLIGCYASSE